MRPSVHEFLRFAEAVFATLSTRFERERVWGPRSVFIAVLLLTRGRRRCTYRELMNDIMQGTVGLLSWVKTPSLSSFSVARRKLDLDACREILRLLSERLVRMVPARLRHPSGRRIIGIDGVCLITPRTAATRRRFNEVHYSTWLTAHCPQALAVVAVDLMRRLPLDAVLLAKKKNERVGAMELLRHLDPGDIAVMDRGFPSRALLGGFLAAGVDVVLRMTMAQAGSWPEVAAFAKSKALQATVEIRIETGRSVPMRLIRRNFRVGRPRRGQKPQDMVIMTSLPAAEFNRDEVIKLYAARWGVETVFREMKCEFDVERFHARSVPGIEQEVLVTLAWFAFAAAIELTAQAQLPDGRRVYRTLCISSAARVVEALLEGKDYATAASRGVEGAIRYHYAPRPGRSAVRECKSPIGRTRCKAK